MANKSSSLITSAVNVWRWQVVTPLSYANPGEEAVIRKVSGSPEVRKHLENLGFVVGGAVKVIASLNGNVIVKVKESRVAIDEEMARKIMI